MTPVLILLSLTVCQVETTTVAGPDQLAQAKLQSVFQQIPKLSKVQVKVRSGVATLSGSVLEPGDDNTARRLANETGGIIHVVDEIQINTAVEGRITPALHKMKEILRSVVASLPLLGISLAVLVVAWLLSRLFGRWDWLYRRFSDRPFVDRLIRQLVRLVIMSVGILLVLEILGITALVGALLGTAGVAGLAVGFAFKDIIENYLAGVILSLRHPFSTGDLVDLEGIQGKLVRLTARDTVLMTLDGNHVRIPNADVFKATITNYTLNPLRRFSFQVGVGNQESLVDVRKEALAVLKSIKGVAHDPPPRFQIDSLGDSSVLITMFGWVDQREADFTSVRTEAVRRVKVALEDNGHDLPEPIYRVVLSKPEDVKPKAPESVNDESMLEQGEQSEAEEIDQQIAQDQGQAKEEDIRS